MTGKRYYLATLGAWKRRAVHFANSHFILLSPSPLIPASQHPGGAPTTVPQELLATAGEGNWPPQPSPDDMAQILVLVEADEGTHLALEDEAAFKPLPHPLAQKPISDETQAALAVHGVTPGATTFEAAEAVGHVHPLLRHRVF
jgi:hypothetical protein